MLDKALALISIACLVVFVGVLVVYIDEIDLTVVSVAVLIMAAYDFILLNRAQPKPEDQASEEDTPR